MKIFFDNSLDARTYIFLVLLIAIASLERGVKEAVALHEVDHRFTVSGYVYDDAGKPLSNASVVIRDVSGTVVQSGKTGSNGAYSLKLHLHNDDVGRKLLVVANEKEKEIVIEFDPYNVSEEREAEINFGAFKETRARSNQGIIIGAVSFAVILIGAYMIFSGKKKHQKKVTHVKKGKGKKNRK